MADKKHCDNCDDIISENCNHFEISVYLHNLQRKIGIDLELCINCKNTLSVKEIANMIPYYTNNKSDSVPF